MHVDVFTDLKSLQFVFTQTDLNLCQHECLSHPDKANVVEDALSRVCMGSEAHVNADKKELDKDVQRLDFLGVRQEESIERWFYKNNESFSQGKDGVIRYQERLCVSDVDGLSDQNYDEAPGSRYFIYTGSTKM